MIFRFGRRTLTRIGLVLLPIMSLTVALSPLYWVILICRFVMGIIHSSMAIGYVLGKNYEDSSTIYSESKIIQKMIKLYICIYYVISI